MQVCNALMVISRRLPVSAADLLRKVLVYDERKKAGEEVGSDAVVASEKDGTCRRSRK